MKAGKLTSKIIVLILFTLPFSAVAAPQPKMLKYFDEKISQVEGSLRSPEANPAESDVKLTDINLDFVGLVSFGLTDVLKLQVSTEIDFVLVPDEAD